MDTACWFTLTVGVPEITPVVEWSDKPVGNEPDDIENPLTTLCHVGVIENEVLFGIINGFRS